MGYELHITRREFWADEDNGSPIALDEWKAYIATDPELRHDGYAEATTNTGETVRIEVDGIAVWTAYSKSGIDGNCAWIYHSGDCIVAKNPDKEIIGKLHRIAQDLDARVQGDDGEFYAEDGTRIETDVPENDSLSGDTNAREDVLPKRPWWRFW